MRKRTLALAQAALALMVAQAFGQDAVPRPVVFVHGDSDSASHWIAQVWRFETNGYPADHLFTVDIPNPSARADDTIPEQNRSSTEDAARALAAQVDAALDETEADSVFLVANSRGCHTARNYERNFGGSGKVAGMVLTGCVHNGVYRSENARPNAEYNGAGVFLTALNEGGLPEGVPITVIRSDRHDLYAQKSARFIGNPDGLTGVSFDAPELEGATNIVLEGVDHRETAYSPEAFRVMFEAITGRAPEREEIASEPAPRISSKVSAFVNEAPSNLALEGATVTIHAVDADTGERIGDPIYEGVVDEDGRYGPVAVEPDRALEFVVEAQGEPTTRIYRSAFPRSSDLVNLRLYPAATVAGEANEGPHVSAMRPRGYFGRDDDATLDGEPMPGVPQDTDVPSVWRSAVATSGAGSETIVATFEGETIAARSGPDPAERVWIEFTY